VSEKHETRRTRPIAWKNPMSVLLARRRPEEDLLQAQETLRITLESIADAVVSTDDAGRVRFLNGAAEALCGVSQAEAEGRPLGDVFRLLDPGTRAPVPNPAEQALRENRAIGLARHGIVVSPQGEEIAIEDRAAPIRDEHGEAHGVVFVLRDVTRRMRAAKRLETQDGITRILSESKSLADAAERIVAAVCEHLSWQVGALWYADETDDVLRCAAVFSALDGPSRHFVDSTWQGTFQRGVGLPGRVWKDGGVAWIEDVTQDANFPRAAAARDEGLKSAFACPITLAGEVQGVMEFFSDAIRRPDPDLLAMMATIGSQVGLFLERRRAEEALRWSEARKTVLLQTTRFLADASAALAELTDTRMTLERVASLAVPFFADYCAVDLFDASGRLERLALAHLDPEKLALARELCRRWPARSDDPYGIRRVLRTGETDWAPVLSDAQLRVTAHGDEHLRFIRRIGPRSYICTPLHSRGRILGVLTFVTAESSRSYDATDVTAAEDLARRAVVAIENARLLATLQEANRRKDEFLAMLAHELRNPLAPIRSAVQILRARGNEAADRAWSTSVIDRQVRQMTRLVDDLLDVSRITRGKVELRREPVVLADVVQSALEASRPLLEARGHHLVVRMPEAPIRLLADPTRLAQVFLNLLNNAAKFTNPGGRIELTVDRRIGEAAVSVKDSGIGIPADMLPRVFEPFAQADPTLDRSDGGLGIGLTLVERLVALHGGTVEARSDGAELGSTFVVRLPIAAEVAMNPTKATPTARQPLAPARRILVVDDNLDAADSLGMLLRMLGNQVRTARDGLEAVGAAEEFHPDVVLLDIGLPKLDGYEAARRIRAQRGGADMLLVALTGWGQPEDRRRSREAGFDHHLTKPVEFDEMKALLASTGPGRVGTPHRKLAAPEPSPVRNPA
jgi:PAS domain S-box-containing protein